MAYGTDAGFTAYCAARSYDISGLADEAARDAAREKASTFVDGLGYRMTGGYRVVLWPGKPLVAGQVAEWPRSGATDAYGEALAETVPQRVENATYEAAYQIAAGVDLNQIHNPLETIIREKVDVIETQFADVSKMTASDLRVSLQYVESLLGPLLGGASYGVTMVVS